MSLLGLSISWVIPSPLPGSGGHRNIFRTVRLLAKFGHKLRVYVVPNGKFKSPAEVEKFINDNYFPIGAEINLGAESIAPCDALFATHWKTADFVRRQRKKAKELFYFVQDFEPLFHPVNSLAYKRAEATYRFGFHLITSGPWCAHLLRKKYGLDADYFLFPIDRSVYYPDKNLDAKLKGPAEQTKSKRRVIFFARPEMPRRLYPLGVKAFAILKKSLPDVEIVFFGSDAVNAAKLPFPVTNLGVVKNLSKLAELYRSADAGVAFSTTNPSLVPFEMMACGCPVVVNGDNDAQLNYGSPANVRLVDAQPEKAAAGIKELLTNEERRRQAIRCGLRFVQKLPTEEEMVRKIESFIKKRLGA